MRVCLLGDATGALDEGMKSTTHRLGRELERRCQVLTVGPRQAISAKAWQAVRAFSPDVIHYLHGPTWRGLTILRFLSWLSPHAVTVSSALRPRMGRSQLRCLWGYRPDLVLVQSSRHKDIFGQWGFRTLLFPSGVDVERFVPLSDEAKQKLRAKHGLPVKGNLVLHVGQISRDRELLKLLPIQATKEFQVVVIGAGTIRPDQAINQTLRDAGCIVRTGFMEAIQELYQLADSYVFPGACRVACEGIAVNAPSIEMPLSVLEAMACNLRVVSTRFGGLTDFIKEQDGFAYANSHDEILAKLKMVHSTRYIDTRAQALPFSWPNLVEQLLSIYDRLMMAKGAACA